MNALAITDHLYLASFLYLIISTLFFSNNFISIPFIQGIEINATEVACQSDRGGVATSGGGFSNYYHQPSWQSAAVSGYFSSLATAPYPGYNRSGRGYPDLSASAYRYQMKVGGLNKHVYGTSLSTPVVAGMISLVNAARLRAGRPSLGWINPILYASYKNFTIDVTSGSNNCAAAYHAPYTCCREGFSAAPGWDPVTGLGVLNFKKFKTFMMNIGTKSTTTTADPSSAPSMAPTIAPSFEPTIAPSFKPTIAPSFEPIIAPSMAPTIASSMAPTMAPSKKRSCAVQPVKKRTCARSRRCIV